VVHLFPLVLEGIPAKLGTRLHQGAALAELWTFCLPWKQAVATYQHQAHAMLLTQCGNVAKRG